MKLYVETLEKNGKEDIVRSQNKPFSSIFSNAERALLVLTFPNISLTLVAVLNQYQTTFLVSFGANYLEKGHY